MKEFPFHMQVCNISIVQSTGGPHLVRKIAEKIFRTK